MVSPIARPEVLGLRASQIREVANAGMGRKDVLPFWVGESDQPTPAFIREATARALMEGETCVTPCRAISRGCTGGRSGPSAWPSSTRASTP
jgi:aspartate/methionine/tyrosine aminotransferase